VLSSTPGDRGVEILIRVQDIPRTVDHAPSKTIYTWKIDLEGVYEQLAANMMKAVCNLTDRIDSELAKRPQANPPFSTPSPPTPLPSTKKVAPRRWN
jgi:hypothetical protein